MPLFLKQKMVVRIICNAKFLDHTSELLTKLKTLRLFQIIHFKTGVIMFKAYHMLLPKPLQNFFSLASSEGYNTRQKHNFKKKYVRTRQKQLCISFSGVTLWNSLDDCIKNCKTIDSFKKVYKQKLLTA